MSFFNAELKTLFTGFKVNKKSIDTAYLFYEGHNNTYIVYGQSDTGNSYSSDDNIAGVVAYYDFDIYSDGNFTAIETALRELLQANGWTWQPNRDSPDLYEKDTGLYHKTCCYAKPLQF